MRWEIQIKSTKINEYLGMMYELVEGGRGGGSLLCDVRREGTVPHSLHTWGDAER